MVLQDFIIFGLEIELWQTWMDLAAKTATIRASSVLITKLLHIDSDCDVEFGFSLHLWALGRKSSFGSSWEEGVETLLIFPNERQWLPTPPAALQTLRKLRKCATSWKQLHQIHLETMWGKLLNWRTITIKLPDPWKYVNL